MHQLDSIERFHSLIVVPPLPRFRGAITWISILAFKIRATIHPCTSAVVRLFRRTFFRLPRPSAKSTSRSSRLERPRSKASLRHLSAVTPFLRQTCSVRSPRVSQSAPAAPRSAATSPRTGVGSGGSPPAAASSTGHVSPSARRKTVRRKDPDRAWRALVYNDANSDSQKGKSRFYVFRSQVV